MNLTLERVIAFSDYQAQDSIVVYGKSPVLWQIAMTLSAAYRCSDHTLVMAGNNGNSTLSMQVSGSNIWQAVAEMLEAGIEAEYEGGILYVS